MAKTRHAAPAEVGADAIARAGLTIIAANDVDKREALQVFGETDGDFSVCELVASDDMPRPVLDGPTIERLALRQKAVRDAREAAQVAQTSFVEAIEGLKRREEASVLALGQMYGKGPGASTVDTAGLEAKLERLRNAVERGADVLGQLRIEVAHDQANRHPQQNKITRVAVDQFEKTVSRRRAILSDAANLGLIDSGAAASLGRVLGSINLDNARDAMANDLLQRATELMGRQEEWDKHPFDPQFGTIDRQLGMARAEYERLQQDTDESQSSGGLSIIEQALHIVLDEQSNDASDGQRQAAKALKREMLGGPGPLLDLNGWSSKPVSRAATQRLQQALESVEHLEHERAQLMAKREAKLGPDPGPLLAAYQGEVAAYLGGPCGDDVVQVLADTRILPSFPPALESSLAGGIQRAEAQLAAVQKEAAAVENSQATTATPSFAARTAAMRAVADLEAYRRETARSEQLLGLARAALDRCEAELRDCLPAGTDADQMLAFLDNRLLKAEGEAVLVFDDTFATVQEPVRITALDWLLHAAQGRTLMYLTDDEATVAWAETHPGELTSVRM